MTKRESKYIRKKKRRVVFTAIYDTGNKAMPFPTGFKITGWHGYIDKKSKP